MLAGYEEWGEDMQNDLDDGLAWMVSEELLIQSEFVW